MSNKNAIKDLEKYITEKENGVKCEKMKKIYAIKDIMVGFRDIFEGMNDAVVLRNFATEAKEGDGLIKKYPEQFELWKVCEINENTGETYQDLRKIAVASDYKEMI
nr:MAG TPA: DNA binding protein [Microviridae sp.]